MLADDRLSHPMAFYFRLTFTGRFDRDRFHKALSAALSRHPLLHAHIRGSAEGETSGLAWMNASAQRRLVSWNSEDNAVLFPEGIRIDLQRETGIRLWANETSETTTLLLQFHHSCSDGIGATHFIESLLTAYTNASAPVPPSPPKLPADSSVLRNRGRLGLSFLETGRRLCRDLPKIAKFFLSVPRPVLGRYPAKPAMPLPAEGPGLLAHSFEETETAQICSVAKQKGVTVNDLLLRDVFVTLDGWNRLQTRGSYHGSLRISMPMTLRSSADRSLPAVNNVSMVFLDRHSSRIADSEALLHGIQAETLAMKQGRLGLTLLWVLRFVGAIPGGLKVLLGGIRCLNSSVLSNLGILFADSPLRGSCNRVFANDLILEGVEFFPPVRPSTNAAFGVVSYGKRLIVGLNYDRLTLTNEDARDLLGALTSQVRQTIA